MCCKEALLRPIREDHRESNRHFKTTINKKEQLFN